MGRPALKRQGVEPAPDLLESARGTLAREGEALLELSRTIGADFVSVCQALFRCKGTVILTGMGKSGLVARKWASTFSSTGTPTHFLDPVEAAHGDLGAIRPQDLLVALSYSGETEELDHVKRYSRELGIPFIAVTGNPNSTLAREAAHVLPVKVSEEACPLGLAPTTSTTAMMAVGDALAVALMELRGFTEKDFARLHPGGYLGRRLWLRVDELAHRGESLPLVEPRASLDKVLMEMTAKRLGLAVVFAGGKVHGVITDGDLRRFLQKFGLKDGITASDLMTPNPRTIPSGALAVEARELMEKSSIQHLLVVDGGGKLVGVVHFQDLLRAKVL